MAKSANYNWTTYEDGTTRINFQGDISDFIHDVDGLLAEIATDPTFKASAATESAVFGPELITSSGWEVPSGWTGTLATGFKNAVGNLNPLTFTMPTATGTKLYQVSFRVESPTPAGEPNASTDFAVTLGNSEEFVTYQGGGNFNYTFGIRSVSNGNLAFIPYSTFDGTIKNVSVKEIIGIVEPSLNIVNGNNQPVFEIRTGGASTKNVFIGKESGHYNTTGTANVAVGDRVLADNTTGYWNTALGAQSLEKNSTGSRNVGVGYLSLQENTSGDRNIAIGTFTLMRNTHGRQNIALGADTLWSNTTGSRNVGIGMASLAGNTTGNDNLAIGFAALDKNISGNYNIAIGENALMSNTTSSDNIAIGRQALKFSTGSTSSINTAIGYSSLGKNTTGNSNTAIGASALNTNKGGNENTVIGHYASASSDGDLSQNTIVGAWAGSVLTTTGDNNTLIGYSAGKNLTTGNNNILVGRNVNGRTPTVSGEINIGNVVKSNIFTKRTTLGDGIATPTARLHLPPQSSAAQSAPLKLSSGKLMTTPETGAFEYDGVNLYFTIGSVRKKIAFV